MKLKTTLLLYFCSTLTLYAQSDSLKIKNYNLGLKFGAGISRFDVNGFVTEDYPSLVFRFGGSISKPLVKDKLLIESGLNFYIRSKSKSPLKDEIYYYGKGSLLPRLDEAAVQNHFALEVPISLKFQFNHLRFVNAGILVRQWAPNNQRVDMIDNQTEFGLLLGLNQKILTDFIIGLELYSGFSNFYHGQLLSSSSNGGVTVKDRSALLSLTYAF